MTRPADLKRFKDDYRQQMEALIEQKKRGKKTVTIADEEDAENIPHTINLMEALKRSLEANKSRGSAHQTKRKKCEEYGRSVCLSVAVLPHRPSAT